MSAFEQGMKSEASETLQQQKRRNSPLARKSFALLGLRDHSAGDPRRRSAIGRTAYRMYYQCRSVIAEDRMIIAAESHVRRDNRNMRGSVRSDDQFKIGDVSCGRAGVVVSACRPGKVRSRRLEVRSLALRNLMDVDGMRSGRQAFDV